MLKALALGADAVLLGRPYAYGLAVGGQEGVEAVITQLMADTDLTLALVGGERRRAGRVMDRGAVLTANGRLAVAELELDPPGPGEALVRLEASGVCHTDLHIVRDRRLAASSRRSCSAMRAPAWSRRSARESSMSRRATGS